MSDDRKNFTMKITEEMSDELKDIAAYYGLSSDAETIRYLIRKEYREKIEKKAQENT